MGRPKALRRSRPLSARAIEFIAEADNYPAPYDRRGIGCGRFSATLWPSLEDASDVLGAFRVAEITGATVGLILIRPVTPAPRPDWGRFA